MSSSLCVFVSLCMYMDVYVCSCVCLYVCVCVLCYVCGLQQSWGDPEWLELALLEQLKCSHWQEYESMRGAPQALFKPLFVFTRHAHSIVIIGAVVTKLIKTMANWDEYI